MIDILKHIPKSNKDSVGKRFSDVFILESSDEPKKLIELHEIIKLIADTTFIPPTTQDSDEIKMKKMKEKNFNTLLLFVLEQSVTIATRML